MTQFELKEAMDKVYSVGFKNGQIFMKSKILKALNRDWSLITDPRLLIRILKKINSMKLAKNDSALLSKDITTTK